MPLKRRARRALSFIFILLSFIIIFLIVSVGFSQIAVNAIEDNNTISYKLKMYDQHGRLLDSNYQSIRQCARLKVYKLSWFGLKKTLIADIPGKNFNNATIRVSSDVTKVYIEFYWVEKIIYRDTVNLLGAQDDNGSLIVTINFPFVPAVPISTLQVESIKVSADIHQIESPYYNIKFGVGAHQHEIEISVGDNVYLIPVYLHFSNGGNSETKPFRFLAQSSKGYVQGKEKWLIWTTAYYWSAVRTTLVGDNMLLVVWTYGYTDIKTAWVSAVISSILAGAVVGATTGIGSVSMGGIAGLASAILWAVHPRLMEFAGTTGIGVVAGIFTPRYFIIQGVSGMGTKETSATISMENLPQSVRSAWGNIDYEIQSSSNQIQVGFTKDYGTCRTHYYDFEEGVVPSDVEVHGAGIVSYIKHSGQYALKIGASADCYANFPLVTHPQIGAQYEVTFRLYARDAGDGGYMPWSIRGVKSDGSSVTLAHHPGNYGEDLSTHFKLIEHTYHITVNAEYEKIILHIAGHSSSSCMPVIDDLTIIVKDTAKYRYIFAGSGGQGVVRYMFGTIPTFAPTNIATNIQNRYTLIAIDVPESAEAGGGTERHGMLALDWQSRRVSISPARIMIKTDVWNETAWLLATDDRDGFKGVNFIICPAGWFVYHTDIQTYYYFTSPDDWTWQPGWTPFVANNTMIYVPSDIGIPPWEQWKWQISGWWEKIGTWGHLALYGLGLLILFIIILILAPWVIFALIKILALIIKAIAKLIVAAAKGMGKMMKSFKRRRRR